MAQKNELDFIETVVASKTLEALLGVKARTVRDLAEKGIVKRDSHGKYLLWNSAKGYITALKAINAGKNGIKTDDDEQELNYDEEHAKHEHVKTQITEIKLKLIQGQVHKAEDVERVMTDMFEDERHPTKDGEEAGRKVKDRDTDDAAGRNRRSINGIVGLQPSRFLLR